MNIFLIASGHSVATIDVYRGYLAALRQLGHGVGEANLHNWYAYHDVALSAWHKRTGKVIPPGYLSQLASEQVANEIVKFRPDVVVAVCGLAMHKVAYDLCWQLGLPMALILTESPYLDNAQAKRVCHPSVKLAFVNDRVSVLGLKRELGLLAYHHRGIRHPTRPRLLYRLPSGGFKGKIGSNGGAGKARTPRQRHFPTVL